MSGQAWVGFDLDGTLAENFNGYVGSIGQPIAPMVSLLKQCLEAGLKVKIVTARVGNSHLENEQGIDNEEFCAHQRAMIEAWCEEHIGQKLEVTATKDFRMAILFDDRCVQIEPNTGMVVGKLPSWMQ